MVEHGLGGWHDHCHSGSSAGDASASGRESPGGAVGQSGTGVYRITRCGWKFDACQDRAAVSPINAAHHLSHTGARVTINNWKMSPRPKLKPIPEDWYPCCTTAKALLPRMPYVSKRRSSAHSAGRCHRSSSINLHVVDSRFTRFNWIPILLVWSCTKISQHSFQENFEHGIFHGICPMHEK